MTSLARRAAPPAKRKSGCGMIGCSTLFFGLGGGTAIALIDKGATGDTIGGVVFVVASFAGLVWLIAAAWVAWRHNQMVFPQLLSTWYRSWMCLACGNVFEPTSPPPPPAVAGDQV